MFKIFWVSEEENNFSRENLDVETINSDKEIQDEEVGQVALDVLEDSQNIYIVAPIAWVLYEEIDLTINKTILTIKWNRQKPTEYNIDWINIRNNECFWWKFIRNVILPENLALNKIKAYMQNNLLIITIPKLRFDNQNIKINKVETN